MPYFPGVLPITLDRVNNRVGINKSSPAVDADIAGRLFVSSPVFPPLFVERTLTGSSQVGSGLEFRATTSADMSGEFGPQMLFSIQDNSGVPNSIAAIRVLRDGADNAGRIYFLAGNLTPMMAIRATGRVGIGMVDPTAWMHLPASTTVAASLRMPHGVAPTSPNNGDAWTETDGVHVYINGVEYTLDMTAV